MNSAIAEADDPPLRQLSSNSGPGSPRVGMLGASSDTMEQAIEALAGPLCALMQQGQDVTYGNNADGKGGGARGNGEIGGEGMLLDPVMAAGCAALGRYLQCAKNAVTAPSLDRLGILASTQLGDSAFVPPMAVDLPVSS